jgi:hypothetical protein
MPFIVVSISKRIIVSGNDDDDPNVSHSLLDNNNDDDTDIDQACRRCLGFQSLQMKTLL